MLQDLFNQPVEIEIFGNKYELEYDHSALIKLEQKTGKGIFELMDNIINTELSLEECKYLVTCALLKHNDLHVVQKLESILEQKPHLIVQSIVGGSVAFLQAMTTPESLKEIQNKEAEYTGKK